MTMFEPSYYKLLQSGELQERVSQAYAGMRKCCLCAWECGVNRLADQLGVCKTGTRPRISSYGPHLGEEDPLRGRKGSGTIFFSRCNLRCQYCQNHDISQTSSGYEVEPRQLAAIMLELQESGCHNINFVSPSHVVASILAGVLVAAQAGLRLPLVYNTGGYNSLAALHLLDGVIDIYMPDMKYASPQIGLRYSRIREYPAVNQSAVREMHRQVGDLQIDEHGLATRGLLVRHLVLPNNLAGTEAILNFLAREISANTYLNLMDQYHPAYKAHQFPKLNRQVSNIEYQQAVQIAEKAGLQRLDQRKPRFWLEF